MDITKKDVEILNGQEELTRYEEAVQLLPLRWRRSAMALSGADREAACEFRLRTGRPVTVLLPDGEKDLAPGDGGAVSNGDLEQLCDRITGYSRYASEETLRCGYLTAEGGFRIGVCGTAVMESGACANLRSFSSMSIRLSRQRIGVGEGLIEEISSGGRMLNTLILSPPGVGKTTLLRDLVRIASDGLGALKPARVAVADERGEIAVMRRGEPQMNVGKHTDVMDGCPKAAAIPMLLRSCNPEIIAVDEITAAGDLEAMVAAAHCGVGLLATIHAAGQEELRAKPLFRQLLELRIFEKTVTIRREGGRWEYLAEDL